MTAEELIKLLDERPFTPLRLLLADGRVHEIRHRRLAIVSQDSVTIGIPRNRRSKIAKKITRCSLPNIIEIEPLEIGGPKKGRGR